MSSTPLTLIEGAYALPRLHPFNDLPLPLRNEWLPLASGTSSRHAQRSLYAALLHTVCLSNRELLSRRRWEARNTRGGDDRPAGLASSAAATPGVARRAMHHDARQDARRDVPRKAAQTPLRIALKPRRPGTAKRRPSRHSHRIAGGVWIVGIVAMLASLAMDRHRAFRELTSEPLSLVASATGNRSGLPEILPPHTDVMSRQAVVVDGSQTQTAHTAPAHSVVAAAAAPASAAVHRAGSRRAPVAPGANTPAHPPQRTLVAEAQRQAVQPPQRAHAPHVPHATALRAAQNTSRAVTARSATRSYASFEQTWPDRGEYAAITTSAITHPRTATSNTRPPDGSTEWMNHMTQRRVTEIPEQFGQ